MPSEHVLETRDSMVEYFVRYLSRELMQVNQAIRMVRIETPILSANSALSSASSDLLNGVDGVRYKLPLVIWQHGKSIKSYQLEFYIMFSKGTVMDYRPEINRMCSIMLKKQCGMIHSQLTPIGEVYSLPDRPLLIVHNTEQFWGGNVIKISLDMDACAIVSVQLEHS